MLRGDVLRLRAPRAARGHEQRGARYGVVVQATDLLALSTVVVAPTSQAARPASFRPEVTIAGEPTRVLVEQLGAADHSRLGVRVGTLDAVAQEAVDHALELVLALGD